MTIGSATSSAVASMTRSAPVVRKSPAQSQASEEQSESAATQASEGESGGLGSMIDVLA